MYKVESLVTAETIINMVMNNERSKSFDCYIECYQNGREQGFIVKPLNFNTPICYYICEHRRSDQICIYKGEYTMQSISENAYNHPNYFERDFDKAVKWLIDELETFERIGD